MEITQIQLFDLFRSKFGDKEAEAFVHVIEEKMDTKINQRMQLVATKDDIADLRIATRDDISVLRLEMAALRESLKGDILKLEVSTHDDIGKMKNDLSRTIYLTSLGQLFAIVAAVVSLTLLLLKK
ncbi:hypothetical protein A4H97_17015 [Niastella yeongjuensis]|uniref:DUF1640 domain-containing protein n=1 Tax=Niastella yeongjuensis TaxID=354355 RepID=A0A1V9E1G1_9BACT|nr:hypothetical protein [Niastella yeongjuensis]OQP39919.1 hypothetical protein A4H97_17015 [Niastella yeongjuensis]SEO10171.1 hypothetical protein SAMN05660816_02148 [Niastella yeongjuensis]